MVAQSGAELPILCALCGRPLGYSIDDQPDWPGGPIRGDCYQSQQLDDDIAWAAEDGGQNIDDLDIDDGPLKSGAATTRPGATPGVTARRVVEHRSSRSQRAGRRAPEVSGTGGQVRSNINPVLSLAA